MARHLPPKPAQDIPFCSILPFLKYSLMHDLALSTVKLLTACVCPNSEAKSEIHLGFDFMTYLVLTQLKLGDNGTY